jgi:hypothetical protein
LLLLFAAAELIPLYIHAFKTLDRLLTFKQAAHRYTAKKTRRDYFKLID